MRISFIGSIGKKIDNFDIVKNNLCELILTLANRNINFLIRASKNENPDRIPIDDIVYEALVQYKNSCDYFDNQRILVYFEPGKETDIKLNIPHISHIASSNYRTEFYAEQANLADLFLGVGGELGLIRFTIIAEWLRKPIFYLPGLTGSSSFLLNDFFKKSIFSHYLTQEEITELKHLPHISFTNPSYAQSVTNTICKIGENLIKKIKKNEEILSPSNITLNDLFKTSKRFSIGLWIFLISLISSIIVLVYKLGQSNYLKSIIEKLK